MPSVDPVAGKTAFAQERIHRGHPAAERPVGLGWVARAAGRIDVVAQALRHSRIEYVAHLLEGVEGIRVEHLGPQKAVVAGRIMVAREDVLEVRRAVADRKSTRLNSSHLVISYAVFCLKKKRTTLT